MNENLKRGLLIGVIVLAIAFAGFQVYKSTSGEQTHVEAEYKVAPGHKSEKELALEAQGKSGGGAPVASDPKSDADKEAALAGN